MLFPGLGELADRSPARPYIFVPVRVYSCCHVLLSGGVPCFTLEGDFHFQLQNWTRFIPRAPSPEII